MLEWWLEGGGGLTGAKEKDVNRDENEKKDRKGPAVQSKMPEMEKILMQMRGGLHVSSLSSDSQQRPEYLPMEVMQQDDPMRVSEPWKA